MPGSGERLGNVNDERLEKEVVNMKAFNSLLVPLFKEWSINEKFKVTQYP